jgi:retinol dehydrogenase 12
MPAPDAGERRVCVVTGATAGIGLAAASALARRGWELVLTTRSGVRGRAARGRIRAVAPGARVHLVDADLASQREVRAAAAEIAGRFPRICALVNNAGTFSWRRRETEEGVEMQLAVNHLSGFLLTRLLLPNLRAAGEARVVTVSSAAHRHGRIHWDDPGLRRRYSGLAAYSQSKLMNLLFTRALARRLEGSGVAAYAMHPGVVATQILLGSFPPLRLFAWAMRTPAEGADTLVHLVDSPAVAGSSGDYFIDRAPVAPAPAARSDADAERLWELSEQMTGPSSGK